MQRLSETPWAERILAELERPEHRKFWEDCQHWGRCYGVARPIDMLVGVLRESEELARENYMPAKRKLRIARDILIRVGFFVEISAEEVARTLATSRRSPVQFRQNGKPYVQAG